MEMKKKLRAFFTLARKGDGGFTLVELIVVIAIIAILGGVATVGYSGYVKKANMQADITLASEIEQALMLAHYSGKLNDGASVIVYYGEGDAYKVVTSDAIAVANGSADTADAAMVATFGEGYADSLRLKYNGWSSELGIVTNGAMIQYVNESAFSADSNNVEGLLDNIQYLTDELAGWMSGVTIGGALADYLNAAGIDSATNPVAASNATTLFVANTIANSTSLDSEEELSNFASSWAAVDFNGIYSDDVFSSYAAQYASVLALATYVDGQTAVTANPTDYVSQLNQNSGVAGTAIKDNIGTVASAIYTNNENLVTQYWGGSEEEVSSESQAYTDAMAFLSYMNGITSSSDSLLSSTNLNSDNYYNDGTLLNYVTDYMAVANAIQNSNVSAEDGAFVFYYNANTQNVSCVPLDY